MNKDIQELLESEARRINHPDFIAKDPVQFPRRFNTLQDIELVAFLAATLAWGNRKMICNDIEKMLTLMDHQPYAYMMDEGYKDLDPRLNIHRTFFAEHLQHFLKGLRRIYNDHGSLDNFASMHKVGEENAPAWKLVELINKVLELENGMNCSRCLPLNLQQSALKRVNMALRWLVRDDGIVDMGVWTSIPKSKLFIPLDVHVGNVSRDLGILKRKQNDRKSVEELTHVLREIRPDDPAIFDFALFGIGIESKGKDLNNTAIFEKF